MLEFIREDERQEIKELVSMLLVLPKEDRTILLSNANALKTRKELAELRDKKEEAR